MKPMVNGFDTQFQIKLAKAGTTSTASLENMA